MANEFDSLLPGNNPKIPSNLNIDNSPFSNLLPQEEKVKYKLSTDGNLSDKLSDKDSRMEELKNWLDFINEN